MTSENSIKIYQDTLNRVPHELGPLVERYLGILGTEHIFFEEQERQGFYPLAVTPEQILQAAEKAPDILSPYTLVKWERQLWPFSEVLKPVNYVTDPTFRKILGGMAYQMEEAVEYAKRANLLQARLIEANLRPQIEACLTGNFEEARFKHLNLRHLPDPELFSALLDTYLDDKMGTKYAGQGWLINRNDGLTGKYNLILRRALTGTGEEDRHRVIAGDAIAYAGLAARKGGWSGNTIPSEDALRRKMGSISYVFLNRMQEKFEEEIKPALLKYVPGVRDIEDWEYKAKKATIIDLILHEGYGHSQVPFDERAGSILGNNYPSVKELACEILAQKAALDLPTKLVDPDTKKIIMAVSLAWWGSDWDSYEQESDPVKKQINQAYAKGARWGIDYYVQRGDVVVNQDNGEIKIVGNLHDLNISAKAFMDNLRQRMNSGRNASEQVRSFIENSSGDFGSYHSNDGHDTYPAEFP